MKKVSSVIGFLILSMQAMALPILSESVDGSGVIATIYPDHEDPNKVYFLPNRGGLQKDSQGVPEFGMSYWGVTTESSDAGGYFAGIFNLRVDEGLQKAIDSHLAKGRKVAVVPVQESHIHFRNNGSRVMSGFFQDVDVAPFAGRAEDSFSLSASLTKNGARMLAAQLKSGATGLDLNYCYSITGLSPVFSATIELNYHKVYEHFLAQATVGKWWWKANIRVEVEKLIASSDIKIRVNGGDAKQNDYVMALVDRMVERFFVPETQNRRNSAGGRFGLSYTRIQEDRTLKFDLTQREKIERDFCVAMGLGQLKNFPHLIVNVDEQDL